MSNLFIWFISFPLPKTKTYKNSHSVSITYAGYLYNRFIWVPYLYYLFEFLKWTIWFLLWLQKVGCVRFLLESLCNIAADCHVKIHYVALFLFLGCAAVCHFIRKENIVQGKECYTQVVSEPTHDLYTWNKCPNITHVPHWKTNEVCKYETAVIDCRSNSCSYKAPARLRSAYSLPIVCSTEEKQVVLR